MRVPPRWDGDDDFLGDLFHCRVEQAAPAIATVAASSWAVTNASNGGLMPAKVSLSVRATVTAGLAKLVEEVKKYRQRSLARVSALPAPTSQPDWTWL